MIRLVQQTGGAWEAWYTGAAAPWLTVSVHECPLLAIARACREARKPVPVEGA